MGRYVEYQTEKQEKWYEAKIWILLLVVGGILFLFTTKLLGEELFYRLTGEPVVVENANGAAILHEPDGKTFSVDLVGQSVQRNADKSITLYYINGDITTAKAMTTVKFWLLMYVIFTPMVAISTIKILHVYKPKAK